MILIIVIISMLFAAVFIISFSANSQAQGIDMDVKCTVYENKDDLNGNDVDVRILVMGLKADKIYTVKVLPDHNPPTTVTTKSDSDGIFWVVAKILEGEKSTLFNVNIYEDINANGRLVSSGNDDAPCYPIIL